jgi:hypothetical protein
MTTTDQITALRKAVAGVRSARPGVARQHMVTAMLAKTTPLHQEQEKVQRYLEAGWTYWGAHIHGEDEKFARWTAALKQYEAIVDVLTEAEAVLGSSTRAA